MSSVYKKVLTAASVAALMLGGAKIAATESAQAAEPVEMKGAMDAPVTAPGAMESPAENSVLDVAAADERFSTLTKLIKAADMSELLESETAVTVFAPTDEAFQKLAPETTEVLQQPENKELLKQILKRHVVLRNLPSDELKGSKMEYTSAAGLPVTVDATKGVMIENAAVVGRDIVASNGVVHAIDTVILPEKSAG